MSGHGWSCIIAREEKFMGKYDFNQNWQFWSEEERHRRNVVLPHDAMLSGKRSADAPGKSAAAFFHGGKYYYEKEFDVSGEWLDRHITFEFEGVYKNAVVWINGHEAYKAAYGYLPFFVCADGFLTAGKNVIRVAADNTEQPDSRWYSGAGICWPVWMHIQKKAHIEQDGIKIRTVSLSPARIQVVTRHTGEKVRVEILDGDTVVAGGFGDCVELEIPNAKLWSDVSPSLYTAMVTLLQNENTVEIVEERFGIRKIEWSPKGLFVNGTETLLRGGCVHHDNGILGACTYGKSEDRRIRILKENGFNAVRSSHNPCSKAMLEACDKYGVYVIDELWDMWYKHKSKYDYAAQFEEHYQSDIRSMVQRDYNHPSVIFYSIGNEVSEPSEEKGVALAKEMTACIKSLDETRAVTGGFNLMIIANAAKGQGIYKEEGGRDESGQQQMQEMNSTMFNMITSQVGSNMNQSANSDEADAVTSPVLDTVDIAGYNYASGRYSMEGEKHPNRVIFGSETFPWDIAKNWAMVKQYPYLVGDFMWTAWDYLGEAGIGAWAYTKDAMGFEKPYPWLLADTGAFDILGNPNGEAMLAKAVWHQARKPLIGVRPVNQDEGELIKAVWRGTNALPTWSWQGCKGRTATVEVYFDAAQVELLLNGKSSGKKVTEGCMASWQIPYEPGMLEAVAYDSDGTECARSCLVSAAGTAGLSVRPEETTVKAGEIVYVDVVVAGENGEVEANCDMPVNVTVENGTLLAFGSANPRTQERFATGSYTTYYGRAQAVVRTEVPGIVTVTARNDGGLLAAAQVEVV